jgi:hypothetical protein
VLDAACAQLTAGGETGLARTDDDDGDRFQAAEYRTVPPEAAKGPKCDRRSPECNGVERQARRPVATPMLPGVKRTEAEAMAPRKEGEDTMKKIFPVLLVLIGLGFLVGGSYTVVRGIDARQAVRAELARQDITTTPDARVPNVKVTDASTAQVMADVIQKHVDEITGGRSYAELGRYLTADGKGDTNDETLAMTDKDGNAVANPIRDVALTADTLRTGLYTSIMALNMADLVIGLGLAIAVIGLVFGGLGVHFGALPSTALARKLAVQPATAIHG